MRFLLVLLAFLLVPASQACAVEVRGDFNRDGRQDLAIGVPGEGLGKASRAGAVNVIYGSAGGGGPAGRPPFPPDPPPGPRGAGRGGGVWGGARGGRLHHRPLRRPAVR